MEVTVISADTSPKAVQKIQTLTSLRQQGEEESLRESSVPWGKANVKSNMRSSLKSNRSRRKKKMIVDILERTNTQTNTQANTQTLCGFVVVLAM